jgi:hypothetical protein
LPGQLFLVAFGSKDGGIIIKLMTFPLFHWNSKGSNGVGWSKLLVAFGSKDGSIIQHIIMLP